jgi:hypothetical protein
MNEVTGSCVRAEFPFLTPPYLASTVEDVHNRLLASVMVDSSPGAWLDYKKSTPQGRIDEEFRCNGSTAFRTRRLGGAQVELLRADNANRFVLDHGLSDWS